MAWEPHHPPQDLSRAPRNVSFQNKWGQWCNGRRTLSCDMNLFPLLPQRPCFFPFPCQLLFPVAALGWACFVTCFLSQHHPILSLTLSSCSVSSWVFITSSSSSLLLAKEVFPLPRCSTPSSAFIIAAFFFTYPSMDPTGMRVAGIIPSFQ